MMEPTLTEARACAREIAQALEGVEYWVPTDGSRARHERVAELGRRLVEQIQSLGAADPLPPEPRVAAAIARVVEHAVFVGGVHKSGTTLMRNLLDGHPEILVLPVDNVLRDVVAHGRGDRHAATTQRTLAVVLSQLLIGGAFSGGRVWALAGRPGDLEPYVRLARHYAYYAARQRADAGGILGTLAGAVMALDEPAAAERRRYWALKGMFHPVVIHELTASFPRARFVQIVRHPAGVIASQRRKQALKGRRFNFFTELETLHEGMALALDNVKTLGPERHHLLKYEDLVERPAEEMAKVARFLGVPFDDVLARPTMWGQATGANTAHPELLREAGVVSAVTSERWRATLSSAEVAVIESYLGPLLPPLGYPRSTGGIARYLTGVARVAWQYRSDAHVNPITRIQPVVRGLLRALAH